jgi:septum formation protein
MQLVLASRSATRLRVLQQAGFAPIAVPSDVDETMASTDIAVAVTDLAYRKARAVAASHPDDVVLGCDSVVVVDGRVLGKPASREEARSWWTDMAGGTVTVWTGHAVLLGDRSCTGARAADVHFDPVLDHVLDAYLDTGDWDGAAGGFRLDGRAGVFIESINGDPGTVHGVSLPFLNAALDELDVDVRSLWD